MSLLYRRCAEKNLILPVLEVDTFRYRKIPFNKDKSHIYNWTTIDL